MKKIEQIIEYLKKKIPNFEKTRKSDGQFRFTCPRIETAHKIKSSSPTCSTISGSENFKCFICGWKGNVYDLIREVEKKQLTDGEIVALLNNETKIDLYPELEEYKKYGWSLLPIAKNGKIPLEKEWTSKTHTEKSDWIKWLEQGLNIGVRTGEVSGIIVIDADLKVAPNGEFEKIYKELTASKTLTQNSPKGKHFVFKYDKEIKQTSKIVGVTIDIRNDGGQFLVAPSRINNSSYNWVNLGSDIKDVPENVKAKLLNLNRVDKVEDKEMSKEMTQIIDNPIELINNNFTGCCNDTFIQFGGVLLKMGIIIDKVKAILFYLNKHWLKNPMPPEKLEAMIGSLNGYKQTEEQTQEHAIYEACKLIQVEISAKDIIDHVFPGEKGKRAIVDKYLSKFHKEGKLVRLGRGRYDCKQAVEWTDQFQTISPQLNYKVPYFNDVARFYEGNIILIGAAYGEGKTTVGVNIIKQLKEQGIKPYYIPLESGSSFEEDVKALGLTYADYYTPKADDDHPPVNPLHDFHELRTGNPENRPSVIIHPPPLL